MPQVNDIIAVAEAMEKSPIAIVGDRCVAVRNRNSTCRRCVNACPKRALSVSGNEVHFDSASCIVCGACVVACPTEALVSLAPTESDLTTAAFKSMNANDGRAVIACARISSKRIANPETYAEVPCLPRVDEVLLVDLVSQGAAEVLLVDGDCSTCKYGVCSHITDATAQRANDLLSVQGSDVRVTRMTGFPDDMVAEHPEEYIGTSRRGFFSEARRSAKETALTAAKAKMAQEFGQASVPEIGERLRVTESGTLPLIRSPRHESAMDALDRLGGPADGEVDSRLFGRVSVDVQTCNSCGMCAVFCPTGALRRDPADKPNSPLKYLEFTACECVQCGLCADVCWKKALTLTTAVPAEQLFSFDPVVFSLAK